MNGAAKSSARALVRANPRRLLASLPPAVARRWLLSAAAALTSVLSRSVLPQLLSSARVLLVLSPAEAGGIRNIEPPNREMEWAGARNNT